MSYNVGQRALALRIVGAATETERDLLALWLQGLLVIEGNPALSRAQKAHAAIRLTRDQKVLWPLLNMLAQVFRKHGWDDRTGYQRWAAIAAGGAILAFGGQSAGIAALGGAIGVPLWVVFGGGAAFARLLLDTARRDTNPLNPSAVREPQDSGTTLEGEYHGLRD